MNLPEKRKYLDSVPCIVHAYSFLHPVEERILFLLLRFIISVLKCGLFKYHLSLSSLFFSGSSLSTKQRCCRHCYSCCRRRYSCSHHDHHHHYHHHQTSQSSRWYSCFIFRRSCIQVSVQRLVTLTEAFHGFSQTFKTNARILLQIRPWLLPSISFPVH